MNERQQKILKALANRPCATLGPIDLIDDDYNSLVQEGYINEYWGSGGVMCRVTEKTK